MYNLSRAWWELLENVCAFIRHRTGYRWITDYRLERGHPISRLPSGPETIFYGHTSSLSLSLSFPFYPFPLLFPGFFPATRSAWIFFLFPISPSVLFPLYAALSERRLDRWVLPSRRELSPRGAEKDRAEFCSFLVLSPPPLLHRFVSHDFRNISSIDQIRFIVNEWLQLVASDFQFVQLSMVVSQNRRCFVRVTRKIWCFLTSLFFCAGIDC